MSDSEIPCSPPGSSVHEILQARILEWVTNSFSGGLPDPEIKPRSLALRADSLPSETPELHLEDKHGLDSHESENEKQIRT